MKRIPRPSPAMAVAIIALIVAIGGTATALPGKFTVGQDDLKKSSVGARSLGKLLIGHTSVVGSEDRVRGDGDFTNSHGQISCPSDKPLAIDPSVTGLGPHSYLTSTQALPSRFGGPVGYAFTILTDEGPGVGYTASVNCLPVR